MIQSALLTRVQDDKRGQGCFGLLHTRGFSCHTAELPWKNNAVQVSRVPLGTWTCVPRLSPRFGWTYHLSDIPGRTFILTHWGNYAGDSTRGWRTHSNGCIILGANLAVLDGQLAVIRSMPTFRNFMEAMQMRPFRLTIEGGF